MKAYCVKCKNKQIMLSPRGRMTKNNRHIAQGACPKCGCKMNKFISKKEAEKYGGNFLTGILDAASILTNPLEMFKHGLTNQ